ncbi:MAG: hypothetical protein QOK23_1497 [Gammaproteobacteria bacterium]|jgi:uncharacterized protein YecA (UPF0149 family)|nr:hypothetical protein [Gammaproteobacteria bacterium]
MSEDQFQKGLANIRSAVDKALETLSVTNANVHLAEQGPDHKQEVVLTISSGGKTVAQVFSRDEVLDSGEAIDAPAALKVRMLASHFVK